jgi:hypothetical protein
VSRMPWPLVSAAAEPLEEFAGDPLLSVACVLLIVVSIAWIIVARAVSRNLRNTHQRGGRDEPQSARDIWKSPPGQ